MLNGHLSTDPFRCNFLPTRKRKSLSPFLLVASASPYAYAGERGREDWCAGVGVKINDLWQVSWLPLLGLRANEQDAEQRKAPAVSEGEMGVAAATASGWKHGKNHDELEGGDRGNKLLPTFHTVSLCC